jgi:hypothetical protein
MSNGKCASVRVELSCFKSHTRWFGEWHTKHSVVSTDHPYCGDSNAACIRLRGQHTNGLLRTSGVCHLNDAVIIAVLSIRMMEVPVY